ncbi:hypothetical protein TNCV_2561641 [Trichonephila clavipes]|uniref:Uncharacterized protein n=1 Tax=Trichonephila clavipes TaxID=2585209 RepID=A0A8X6UW37_TRICX|nr:hypothetical protein TNCV_2561641 [Trichonephila clavipes]
MAVVNRSFEHHIDDSTIWFVSIPILREVTWGGQVPPTPSANHTRGLAARRLFRVPPCHKLHYTFTNIHVFSGFRTQSLRHRSQRR